MQKTKSKVVMKKDIKQDLNNFLENLSFLEQITGGNNTDLSKVGLPVPTSEILAAWATHPKIKLDKILDQKRNLAFSNELMNLLKGINIKVYLFLAKIYHQSKKILDTEGVLSEDEQQMFLSVRTKTVNVAKNMYAITNYPYYREIIEMK